MQTISLPVLEAGEYAGGIWYYEPHTYQSYRYVLGRVGKHPLVCIGINPSTAQPGALDPTLKSVERLAAANGFDSWIMFNVYPQRATDPNDMDKTPDRALCDENLRWLQAVLAQTEPTMWAAWGTLIEKRDYLRSDAGDGGPDAGAEDPVGHLWQAQQKGAPAPPAVPAQGFHPGAL
mgnify:CR=1 FL=1